jgi:hypothetical protein
MISDKWLMVNIKKTFHRFCPDVSENIINKDKTLNSTNSKILIQTI